MFKRLLLFSFALCCTILYARAQDPGIYPGAKCGFSPSFARLASFDSASVIPAGYHLAAIKNCGHFQLYYDDINLSTGGGFDSTGGVGATRQNTLCKVFEHIQSVFDFSSIPPNYPIRINIKRSPTHGHRVAVYGMTGIIDSGPYYDTSAVAGDTVNGFVWDYVKDSVDPAPGRYHAYMQVDFDSVTRFPDAHYIGGYYGGTFTDMEWNEGLDTPGCTYDLFSTALHAAGHTLGWVNWKDWFHGTSVVPALTSDYELSIHQSPHPHTLTSSLTLTHFRSSPTTSQYMWVNDKQPPYNHPLHYDNMIHFADSKGYINGMRISPGDNQDYVMQTMFYEGQMRRKFTKGDLETFHDVLGYKYTHAYDSTNADTIANSVPWSTKMSFRYNPIFDTNFHDIVDPDFTMVNDSANTVVYSIASDTTLKDADGDTLYIMPGSLVNFRGCGEVGNNHNRLTIDATGRVITYSPRHNFVGRAQYGYNLWDKKEKGAFVMVTIDVSRGNNNDRYIKGNNMVLNGDFEEGSEVKTLNNGEFINNANTTIFPHISGRLAWGYHFKDCHSSYNETAIQYSYVECSQTTKYRMAFGNPKLSFPWIWPEAMVGTGVSFRGHFPDSSAITGSRYETMTGAGLYALSDTLKKCHRYVLEYDVIHPISAGHPYGLEDTIVFGFADYNRGLPPDATPLLRKLVNKTKAIHAGSWTHMKIPFTYCSDTVATALYLKMTGYLTNPYSPTVIMDNLSLKEVDLTVSIIDSNTGRCQHTLIADLPGSHGCDTGMQYSWNKMGDPTVLGIGASFSVNARDTTYYIVTVSDGCSSAADTVRLNGCSCVADRIFTTAGYSVLSGLYTGTTGSGNYYVDNDLIISRTTSFSDAKLYMAPGVTITVLDTVKLTLERSHLFTCPDTGLMWKGIVLNTGSTSSATIAVMDNSMIEDAEIGIKAVNPKTPASGDIISCESSVFNSNNLAVYIENYLPSSPSTYPFSFVNSVFSSRLFNAATYTGYPEFWPGPDVLKATVANGIYPPFYVDRYFAKIKCKNDQQAEAGIRLKEVGDESSGSYAEIIIGGGNDSTDNNLFDNMGAGIYGENANITAYNNTFINMPLLEGRLSPFPLPGPIYRGCGIWVSSDKTVKNRLRVKQLLGVNGGAFNKFYDCYKGISVNNYYDLDFTECFITGSHRSYGVTSSTGTPIDLDYGIDVNAVGLQYNAYNIRNNTICNRYTGIYINLCAVNPWAITEITFNKFYAEDPFIATTGQYMKQGISITSSSLLPLVPAHFSYMNINHDSFYNVYGGIMVNNIQHLKPVIAENYITMRLEPGTAKAQYGIGITRSFGSLITNNNVSGIRGDNIISNDKARAFYVAYSNGTTLCSNDETRIGRGFDFAQMTGQGIRWVHNHMDSNMKGFVLGSDIGDQVAFYGVSSLGPLRTSNHATYSNWETGVWSSTKFQTFVENSRLPTNSRLFVRTIPASENPTFNSATISFAPRYDITSIIPDNSGLMTECLVYLDTDPGPSPSYFKTIADSLNYGTDGKVNQWLGQYGVYLAAISNPQLVDSFIEFNHFMASAVGSRFEWLKYVEDALGNGDTNTATTLLASPVPAMGRVQVDTNVAITDYTEADYVVSNYAAYYALYLKYLKGAMDTADLPAVAAIAGLCPANYGGVVYQARAFYDRLTDQQTSYEDDSCMYIGQSRIVTKGIISDIKQHYSLFPNPNDGNMSIRQYAKDEQPVQLMLYDMQGRLVYRTTLNFNQRSDLTLHVPSAMPGMYLIRLRDSQGKNYTLKFQVK